MTGALWKKSRERMKQMWAESRGENSWNQSVVQPSLARKNKRGFVFTKRAFVSFQFRLYKKLSFIFHGVLVLRYT